MRGYDQFNFKAFDRARDYLKACGHDPISPADMDRELGFDETLNSLEGFDYKDAMRRDIDAIFNADAIFMLNGWQASKGANAELALATALDLRILFDGECLL
jgi:hypothetical protein